MQQEVTTAGGYTIERMFDDVLRARARIAAHLQPTPLRSYAALNDAVGSGIRVLVKHENLQPTGAFKVRNALSAVTALAAEERGRGIIAATTGNHGQGLAYAARLIGAKATLCVPVGNNPAKNAAMRAMGADVVEVGCDYDEALTHADELARDSGAVVIHSTDNRDVLAGAGTLALEVFEKRIDVDAVIVAIGGGSQAAGAIVTAAQLSPRTRVFGVQAAGAPAVHDSWHARRWITHERIDTFAEGVATRTPYAATFDTLCDGLAGFVTVTDGELLDAMRSYWRLTEHLTEGAGAASLAGLLKLRETLAGQTVVVVLSGGNIDEPRRKLVTAAAA